MNEISLERRNGYAWYRDTPELALQQYARWSQEHPEVKVLEKEKLVWTPDNGDGTYKNPIIFADYSDPDVVRVGDDFYLVASSFNCAPGLPILHSKDLVNWTIIGHVFQNYPVPGFDAPQHGNGVWAPSLRYHNGEFYVYFGDPDNGIFMSKAKNPAGPWAPLHLVQGGQRLDRHVPVLGRRRERVSRSRLGQEPLGHQQHSDDQPDESRRHEAARRGNIGLRRTQRIIPPSKARNSTSGTATTTFSLRPAA